MIGEVYTIRQTDGERLAVELRPMPSPMPSPDRDVYSTRTPDMWRYHAAIPAHIGVKCGAACVASELIFARCPRRAPLMPSPAGVMLASCWQRAMPRDIDSATDEKSDKATDTGERPPSTALALALARAVGVFIFCICGIVCGFCAGLRRFTSGALRLVFFWTPRRGELLAGAR